MVKETELIEKSIEYVNKFWYEQPADIKTKLRMAYRAGLSATNLVEGDAVEKEQDDLDKLIEWTQWLGEMGWYYVKDKDQWEHDDETGCFKSTKSLVQHYNADLKNKSEKEQSKIEKAIEWCELKYMGIAKESDRKILLEIKNFLLSLSTKKEGVK